MAFYVGCYLIQQDALEPSFDGSSWALPDIQHAKETSNVEELLMDPEDFDALPTQIQFGCAQWTDSDDVSISWAEFYLQISEKFYVFGFSPTDLFTEFYVKTQEQFYIRGFTPGSELYDAYYVSSEPFYLRNFSPTDLFSEFYLELPSFYIRNFSPTDFFYLVPEEIC